MFKFTVLTVSDRCSKGETIDKSGKLIIEFVKGIEGEVVKYDIVPDEANLIKERLLEYCDSLEVDVVFTTGGTGLLPGSPKGVEESLHSILGLIPHALLMLHGKGHSSNSR